MFCSSCSEPVRPVVAIDIDGTLGDWHQLFYDFWARYWDVEPLQPWNGHGKLHEHLGATRQEYRNAKLAFRQGGFKRWMHAFPHAAQLVHRLRLANIEVWITTTRPYLRLDNTDPDTREWLARNNINYDGLLYDEDKYNALLNIVDRRRIVAVLDDEAENYDRAADLGLHPVMIARRHNRVTGRPVMADNLEVFGRMALDRAARWRAQHASAMR